MIWLRVVIISIFPWITVPVSSAAVRSNTEIVIQVFAVLRIVSIVEVYAPECRKFQVHCLFNRSVNRTYAPDLLISSHFMPFLAQWDTSCVVHDNIFSTDEIVCICSIIMPVKDPRNGDTGLRLYYNGWINQHLLNHPTIETHGSESWRPQKQWPVSLAQLTEMEVSPRAAWHYSE